MKYEELTWPEVSNGLAEKWLILPLGSIEQHGPHLPLCVDSMLAESIAVRLAQRVSAIIAPTFSYGARSLPNSGGGPSYPGTIHLSGQTLLSAYKDLVRGYVAGGARRLLVLNGHWENEGLLFEAIDSLREARELGKATVLALSWWSLVQQRDMQEIFGAFSGWHTEHADRPRRRSCSP
jgi:creatinine amidohydrolase